MSKSGRRDLLGPKVIPETPVLKAQRAKLEPRDPLVLMGKTAHRAPPERMESPLRPLR